VDQKTYLHLPRDRYDGPTKGSEPNKSKQQLIYYNNEDKPHETGEDNVYDDEDEPHETGEENVYDDEDEFPAMGEEVVSEEEDACDDPVNWPTGYDSEEELDT